MKLRKIEKGEQNEQNERKCKRIAKSIHRRLNINNNIIQCEI